MKSTKIPKRICTLFLLLFFSINCAGCLIQPEDIGRDRIDDMMELRRWDDMTYTNSPVFIPDSEVNLTNFRQTNASVDLFVQQNELLFVFLGGRTVYDYSPENIGKLGVLRDGQAQYFRNLQENSSEMLVWEGYVYYKWISSDAYTYLTLHRFDLRDGTSNEIESCRSHIFMSNQNFSVGIDGVPYYVSDSNAAKGYPILNGEAGELTNIPCTYELGDHVYYGNWVIGGSLSEMDATGKGQDVPLGGGKEWFLPYGGGLLVMNLTNGNTLHYIDENGTITELFRDDCDYGVMAVNSWGNYVFVSIQRYEMKEGRSNHYLYENDTQSGTYRIDMQDFSIKKISDNAYNGLYIFSEGEIFACDRNSNVDKLDFNGTHLMDIIMSKG